MEVYEIHFPNSCVVTYGIVMCFNHLTIIDELVIYLIVILPMAETHSYLGLLVSPL